MDCLLAGVDQELRFALRDGSNDKGKVCQVDVTNLKVKRPQLVVTLAMRVNDL